MTAARLPRPAALATVLLLLVVAIVAFPREAHGQIGGRVLNPNGVTPTATTVLVTIKGPEGESTRQAIAGRFMFPALARGTRVTVQAGAPGLISKTVAATAPDTLVVLVLRAPQAGERFNIVPQGSLARRRPAAAPVQAETAAAPAQPETAAAQDSAKPNDQPTSPATTAESRTGATAQGLAVQDALFTAAELVDREPASVSGCTAAACATRYSADVGTVTFWTRLTGGSPGRWVEHVWYHGEREIARVRQKVEGPTWRTWTRKRILPEWTGDWRVEVVAEDGTVLAERFFTVEQ